MRWLLLALIPLVESQFFNFGDSGPSDDSLYADQFGFKDSINQWGDMIKRFAHKQLYGGPTPAPSEFQNVAPPADVDKIDPKAIQSKKHDIINAKLLDLILPRFKGQPPVLLRTTTAEGLGTVTTNKPNIHKASKKPLTTTEAPEDDDDEDEDEDEDEDSQEDDDDDSDEETTTKKPVTKKATKKPSPTTTKSTTVTTTTEPPTTTSVNFETTKKIVEIIGETLATVGKKEEETSATTTLPSSTKAASSTTTPAATTTNKPASPASEPTTKKLNVVFHTAAKEKFDEQTEKDPQNSTAIVFDSQLEEKVRKMMKEIFEKEFQKKIDSSSKELQKELQKHKAELLKTATEHLSVFTNNSIIADLASKWTDKMGSTTTQKGSIDPAATTLASTTTKKAEETTLTSKPTTEKLKDSETTTASVQETSAKTTVKPKESGKTPKSTKVTKATTTAKPDKLEESGMKVVKANDEEDSPADPNEKTTQPTTEAPKIEETATVKAEKVKKPLKKTTTTTEIPEVEDDDDDDDSLEEADIDEIEKELEEPKKKLKKMKYSIKADAEADEEEETDEERKENTPITKSAMKVVKAIDMESGERKDDVPKRKKKQEKVEEIEEEEMESIEGSAMEDEDPPTNKKVKAEDEGDEESEEPLTGENQVEKSSGIPEAEEADAVEAEEKEYEKLHDAVTEAVTTTTSRPNATQTGQNIFNLQANANSDASPNIPNVIAPVAGIIDGIAPILFPFLQSRGFSARAAAQGAPIFQATNDDNRDLLENGTPETSLVGLSSQLAREILVPGSLRREREEMETQLRQKAAEAKAKLAERDRARQEFEAQQEEVKRQLIEREQRMSVSMHNNPQPRRVDPNLSIEKEFEAAAAQTFKQETDPPSPSVLSITPSPRHLGLRAPPPPPIGYRPKGYDGPLPPPDAVPDFGNEPSEVEEVIGGTTREGSFHQLALPTPVPDQTRSLAEERKKFVQMMRKNQQNSITSESDGEIRWESEDGNLGPQSAFVGDSGLLTSNNRPPPMGANFGGDSFGITGGGDEVKKNPLKPTKKTQPPPMPNGVLSFGGGKRPTVSFDEVEKHTENGGMDFFG